jgi:glyoxalase family protein
MGAGAVHHLAWRVRDEAHQLEVRAGVLAAGAEPTRSSTASGSSRSIPRPGGVLFELATDGPGFAVDEDRAHLGESLVLPPWLEPSRDQIEAALPPLQLSHA